MGYVIGEDRRGNLMVLGGNQRNLVCTLPFAIKRATGTTGLVVGSMASVPRVYLMQAVITCPC